MTNVATQTLALAAGVGCLVSLLCDRMRLSATLPLIAVGFLMGPHVWGVIDTDSLGNNLSAMISVIIGLLIFEGGLHLNGKELSHAPRALAGLLTVGGAITYAGVAAAAHFLAGLSWPISLLIGSVLMVTGPTVIQPMLRHLPLAPRLHATLAGEAILIDPIGVVVAATTLELISAHLSGALVRVDAGSLRHVFEPFAAGTIVGVTLGVVSRTLIELVSHRRRVSPDLVHMLAVGTCMIAVGAGESFASEAGLVAAALCSVIMANTKILGISEMLEFKHRLASIFVAMLFVLLASRMDLGRVTTMPPARWLFVLALIVVVRPVSGLTATIASGLSGRERAFLGLFAPRGLVAASLGSLLATQLAGPIAERIKDDALRARVMEEAAAFDQLVFLSVIGTILWAAVLGPALARVLRVRVPAREGVVIIGANRIARAVGRLLAARNIAVHMVDSNRQRVALAQLDGIEASAADATDRRWMDDNVHRPELGWLMPLTGNRDVDLVTSRWAEEKFGPGRVLWPRPLGDGPAGNTVDAGLIHAGEAGVVDVVALPPGTPSETALAAIDERGRIGPVEMSVKKPGGVVIYLRRPGWANDPATVWDAARRRAAEGPPTAPA